MLTCFSRKSSACTFLKEIKHLHNFKEIKHLQNLNDFAHLQNIKEIKHLQIPSKIKHLRISRGFAHLHVSSKIKHLLRRVTAGSVPWRGASLSGDASDLDARRVRDPLAGEDLTCRVVVATARGLPRTPQRGEPGDLGPGDGEARHARTRPTRVVACEDSVTTRVTEANSGASGAHSTPQIRA